MAKHGEIIAGHRFIEYLCDQGIIPQRCHKVIIEADYAGVVEIHYSVYGDTSLLELDTSYVERANWREFVLNADGEHVDVSSSKSDKVRQSRETNRVMDQES